MTPRQAYLINSTGIILLAHGRPGYAYMAHNMAMSIKTNGCTLPICVFASRDTFGGVPLVFFDDVKLIEKDFFTDIKGNMSVAKSKIELIKNLPFENNLYLDVDGLALKDITALIEKLIDTGKPYVTDVMGSGKFSEDISYDCWAKHEYAWPFFDLDLACTWRTVQSSYAFYKKGEFTKQLYIWLSHYHDKGYPLEMLKERWAARQLPDELLFSGVCAKLGYDPSFEGQQPIFFGNYFLSKGIEEMLERFYVMSMWGNGSGTGKPLTKLMYQEYYSGEVYKMGIEEGKKRGFEIPYYKHEYCMRDKIVNFK